MSNLRLSKQVDIFLAIKKKKVKFDVLAKHCRFLGCTVPRTPHLERQSQI